MGYEQQPPVPTGSLSPYDAGEPGEPRIGSCRVLGTPSQLAALRGAAEHANQKGQGDSH